MSKAAKPKSLAALIDDAPAPAPVAAPEPEAQMDEGVRKEAEPFKYVAPTPNPREEALARLHAQSLAETGNDSQVPLDERTHLEVERPIEEDGTHADPAVPMLVATPGEEPAAPAEPETPAAAPAPEGKKYKVAVKGQEEEVPETAVIEAGLHALRHHGAAELALREATNLLAQARGIAQPTAPAPQQTAPASTQEDARALAEALQFGTREDAARAVAAMMNRGVAPTDVNDVVARTVETRVRDVLDQDKAAKQLEALVPEMLTDKRVLALMATEERAARAAGDNRPYTQLYPEIGQKIRGWIDSFKPKAASNPPAAPAQAPAQAGSIAAKAAAKAAAPSPVSGRGASPAAPTQPKVPTGSEIVAQMRAARGQRQYTNL